MVIIIILLSAALIICFVKLYITKYDLNKIAEQLADVNLDLSTNQLIRTSIHNRTSNKLTNRINELLQHFREDRLRTEEKEIELKKEMVNISHDLRTPLTSIKGYSDLLQVTDNKEQQQAYVEIINRKIEMLLYTVNGFYEIASIGTDHQEINFESIEVRELIVELLLNHFQDFEKAGLELNLVEAQVSMINGDRRIIERIIINIIQNILRYAKQQVNITFEENEIFVIIQFENDSAYELPSNKEIERVFERSVTLDESRSKGQRGLGLYIVKQLMEQMNGEVGAKVLEGKFLLRLHFRK